MEKNYLLKIQKELKLSCNWLQLRLYQEQMIEIGLLIFGIIVGILSGLFGIGGGIVLVPSLIVIFGMNILDANATSLAAMLLPVGILGVISYYKAGLIKVREALWIALGLFLGSFLGGEFAVSISESLLAKLYAGILLYIALSYFDVFSYFRKKKNIDQKEYTSQSKPLWLYLLVGIGAGIFAGLFGKGGGIVIVPLLITFFKYDAKAASATSLAALQLPVGLPSVIVYAQAGYLNWVYAGLMALGIVVGVIFGTKMAIKLSGEVFKKAYAVFLLGVAVYMVVKYI